MEEGRGQVVNIYRLVERYAAMLLAVGGRFWGLVPIFGFVVL